ncbi:hypothetical protein PHPALM_27891 [Phytophthora palmivora]|uniref:Uncharacterized protein n=1 Tax=Phytophthora palmivora TaxID=4796 RepID=A0A2P4XBH9_9STRA|nr:hypothetical protein PHPALM_27891 [Phytophthora palmivora]
MWSPRQEAAYQHDKHPLTSISASTTSSLYRREIREPKCSSVYLAGGRPRIDFDFQHPMWHELTMAVLTPAPAYLLTRLLRLCYPFDLLEAEAELVSGYNVEYSAMGFASLTLGWGAGNGKGGRSRDGRYLATYICAHSVAGSAYIQYERAQNEWYVWASRWIQHISEFVLHGFRFGYGSGGPIRSETIMTVLHGIRHFFAAAGYVFLITPAHSDATQKAPRASKSPVSKELLENCFRGLSLNGPFEQALWEVLCLSLFFLLRRS